MAMKAITYSLLALSVTLLLTAQATAAPADISGLALWLDAADAATITTVDDGGTLRVAQWNDKSGQNNHFAQANVSQAPVMTAAPDNSLPSVAFSGQYLATSNAITPDAVNGGTWFSVYHMLSWNGNQTIISKGDGSNFQIMLRPSSGIGSVDQNNYSLLSGGDIAESNPWAVNINETTLHEISYDASKPDNWISFFENGNDIGSSSAITPPLVADDLAMTLGANLTSSGIDNFLYGHLLELVFYDRALTVDERNEVGYYLANKHGIDASYVPEPATMAVLALGACHLLRRRRKA